MNARILVFRSLRYYWRTNAAVVLGVAVAIAVLSGALLVGDSVRGSLRSLVLQRLGNTDYVVTTENLVREELAEEIALDLPGGGATPLIIQRGLASLQGTNGNAASVLVYGIDDRFWAFHNLRLASPDAREALISPALATALGARSGETILIRIQRPTDIPLESLHGRKEDASRTVRATVREILPAESLGEFSLQAQQSDVRAVFLPLSRLQEELQARKRVNTILVSGPAGATALEQVVRKRARLQDLGVRFRILSIGAISLESDSGLLSNPVAESAASLTEGEGLVAQPLLTYLANSMRVGTREVPYSLVTASDTPEVASADPPRILLNDWAARDLDARPGETLTMEYFVWEEPGTLVTRTARLTIVGIVPVGKGDPDLAPIYPGMTDASSISEWDPPFPLDLRRVRPIDEDYWERFVTTPKAFVSLETGQNLWQSRYGGLSAIRYRPTSPVPLEPLRQELEQKLLAALDPLRAGLAVGDVRVQSLDASKGATNFGEYFVYFSFFLVVSALLLSALFFKLSVEQRIREIGLLRALGYSPAAVRRLFLGEGLVLSLCGAVGGTAGAVIYASTILAALRTWWVGAIGTESIGLHTSSTSLLAGAVGGVLAAMLCIWITLRGLQRFPERMLLAGQLTGAPALATTRRSRLRLFPIAGAAGLILLIAGMTGAGNPPLAFFGSGFLCLIAALGYFHSRLSKPVVPAIVGNGWRPVARLGLRNNSFRPARSVVAMATIASATFILISVDSFRKEGPSQGTGGYSLMVRLLAPIAHDPNGQKGRELLGLTGVEGVNIEPFRVRPGDDASCLNLYEPRNPRILAPRDSFIAAGRFAFQTSLATTDAERENPWQLLHKEHPDGAIPVIADANSLTYVLHRKVGEDFVVTNRGQDIRLRFVAALSDSVFQSELLISEENFLKYFPEQEGYSFLLAEASSQDIQGATTAIGEALADYGAEVTSTEARLAEFHRVENTYLSTFQMLGSLGLLLGTAGMAAVLLRNILERRRELALLRVLGYQRQHFFLMTLMENAFLLIGGLASGVLCALVAIAPTVTERGGRLPAPALIAVLAIVVGSALVIALIATLAAIREAVLPALRSE